MVAKPRSVIPNITHHFDPSLDDASDWPLKQYAETAAQTLNDEVGATASPAVVLWRKSPPSTNNLPPEGVIELVLRDPELGFSITEALSQGDFAVRLDARMLRLWGDFLKMRSSVRIQRLKNELRNEGNVTP